MTDRTQKAVRMDILMDLTGPSHITEPRYMVLREKMLDATAQILDELGIRYRTIELDSTYLYGPYYPQDPIIRRRKRLLVKEN